MISCLSWIITPFSSVRRIGDDGGHGPPQRIRLCLASSSPPRIGGNRDICDNHSWRGDQDEDRDSGQESDYENHPGGGRLKKLAGEVIYVNPSFLKSSSGSYSSSGKPHGWCWNGKGCLWGPGGQSVLRHSCSRFSSQWYQWAVSSFVQLRYTLLTDIQSGVEVVCGQRKELELEFWEERVVEALEGDIHCSSCHRP